MAFIELSPDIKLDGEAGPSYVELPADAKLDQESPASDLWTGAERTVKGIVGLGEAAGMFGSGLVGAGAAGIVGLRHILAGRPPEEVTREMGRVGEALTYKPQTEAGKRFAGGLEWGMGKVAEAGKFAGETTQDILNKSQWTRPLANIGATAADVVVQTAAMLPLGVLRRAKPMIGPRELDVPLRDIRSEATYLTPELPAAPERLALGPGQIISGELPPGPRPPELLEQPAADWILGKQKTILRPGKEPPPGEGGYTAGIPQTPETYIIKPDGTMTRVRTEPLQLESGGQGLRLLAPPQKLLAQPPNWIPGKPETIRRSYERPTPPTAEGFKGPGQVFLNTKQGTIEVQWNPTRKRYEAVPAPEIISHEQMAIRNEELRGLADPLLNGSAEEQTKALGQIKNLMESGTSPDEIAHNVNNELIKIAMENVTKGGDIVNELNKAKDAGERTIRAVNGITEETPAPMPARPEIVAPGPSGEVPRPLAEALPKETAPLEPAIKPPGAGKILSSEAGFIELPKEKIEAAIDRFKEFWVPLSTLPHRQEILAARGKALGGVARVESIVNKAWTRLDNLPEQSKEDVFKAMSGQKDMLDLSEADAHTARHFLNVNDIIGEMLVKRGILTVDQFNAHKGQYIRYMYLKHVLGEDAKIPTRPNGKLDLSYQKSRQDLTWEQRRALGIIENASIAEPLGMAKSLSDIVKFDYLEKIASDPRNVWEPSIIEIKDFPKEFTERGAKAEATIQSRLNGDKFSAVHMAKDRWIVWNQDTGTAVGRKMGIGELVKEVDIYKKMDREMPNTPEIQGRLNTLQTALDSAKEATKNIPKDFVQMPESKHWGPLAGAFVRKPIARDLMGFWGEEKGNIQGLSKAIEGMARLDEKLTGVFKVAKAPLNLPTAARNMVSDFIQLGMSGMLPQDIQIYTVKAIQNMIDKTPEYGQAYRNGLFKTNWSVTELNEVMSSFRKMQGDTWGAMVGKMQDLAKWYGKIDDLFKMAKYLEQREQGMPIEKAVIEAQKWGMDYSLADPSIKWARRHFIPFASYQYKIAPLIAESAIKRPWVIGSLMALPYMVWEAAKVMNKDMTEEDWQELRKSIPADLKERGTWMLLPVKIGGKWRWFDYSYMLPWGNIQQAAQAAREGNIKGVAGQFGIAGTPLTTLVKTFGVAPLRNEPPREPFSNQPIYNQLDPPYLKAGKTMEFFYNMFAPSMLTRYGALGYTASIGKEDRWGRKIDLQQAIPRWFGVNLAEANPKVSGVALKAQINALRDEFIKIQTDPNISPERKDKYRQRLLEEINDLLQKRNQ